MHTRIRYKLYIYIYLKGNLVFFVVFVVLARERMVCIIGFRTAW